MERAAKARNTQTLRRLEEGNPAFRDALRAEALDAIRTGDIETGRSMLRKYFGDTESLAELAAAKELLPKIIGERASWGCLTSPWSFWARLRAGS